MTLLVFRAKSVLVHFILSRVIRADSEEYGHKTLFMRSMCGLHRALVRMNSLNHTREREKHYWGIEDTIEHA